MLKDGLVMPRVLLTTDEPNFTLGLVEGYRTLGWEVVTGTTNFRIKAAHYDVVHHQWPEEFSGWRAPSERELQEIKEHLQWWHLRSFTIFTVNNLHPHQLERNEACHRLYDDFVRHSHLITHYAETSRQLMLEEYPSAREVAHVVHQPANYEVTLARQIARGSHRKEMGIAPDDFVILVLGALRSEAEVRLIRAAFDMANIPKKRLLMAGKLRPMGPPMVDRWKRLMWRAWLRRRHAVVDTRYVPENEVSRFWDTCDVAIVPRLGGLNSGIVFAGMTFGKPVIAPHHGVFPDQLHGTRNWLYETGNAADLAVKLEEASRSDLKAIGRENAEIAAEWTWKRMVQACLEAASKVEVPTAAPIRALAASARET